MHAHRYRGDMRTVYGMSIIELLVVVAVLAVALGGSFVIFNGPRVELSQASRATMQAMTKARFDAVAENRSAIVRLETSGRGAIVTCIDEDVDGACGTSEETARLEFGSSTFPRIALLSTTVDGGAFAFDLRGLPQSGIFGRNIVLGTPDASLTTELVFTATGGLEIQ